MLSAKNGDYEKVYFLLIIAETWTLRAVDQKQLETFEMWCWRRMEKIIWADLVRNEEVLLRVKEQRNILHGIRKRKANWIGHIMRRNCLLQRVTEGKIQGGVEVTGRQGRRRRKLLDDLKERRGYSHLKEEAAMCAMLLRSIAHSIIYTRLFRGKMHSDWFNGIVILQGRWQRGEKVGYCYPSELKSLFVSETHMSRWSRKG
jgi:hypothetical protein